MHRKTRTKTEKITYITKEITITFNRKDLKNDLLKVSLPYLINMDNIIVKVYNNKCQEVFHPNALGQVDTLLKQNQHPKTTLLFDFEGFKIIGKWFIKLHYRYEL